MSSKTTTDTDTPTDEPREPFEIILCPTCLRAFDPSEYGPAVCEDCFIENVQRHGMGGRRYATEHGSKKHTTPLCPHVRGSVYYMMSDESATYALLGPCKTCTFRSGGVGA